MMTPNLPRPKDGQRSLPRPSDQEHDADHSSRLSLQSHTSTSTSHSRSSSSTKRSSTSASSTLKINNHTRNLLDAFARGHTGPSQRGRPSFPSEHHSGCSSVTASSFSSSSSSNGGHRRSRSTVGPASITLPSTTSEKAVQDDPSTNRRSLEPQGRTLLARGSFPVPPPPPFIRTRSGSLHPSHLITTASTPAGPTSSTHALPPSGPRSTHFVPLLYEPRTRPSPLADHPQHQQHKNQLLIDQKGFKPIDPLPSSSTVKDTSAGKGVHGVNSLFPARPEDEVGEEGDTLGGLEEINIAPLKKRLFGLEVGTRGARVDPGPLGGLKGKSRAQGERSSEGGGKVDSGTFSYPLPRNLLVTSRTDPLQSETNAKATSKISSPNSPYNDTLDSNLDPLDRDKSNASTVFGIPGQENDIWKRVKEVYLGLPPPPSVESGRGGGGDGRREAAEVARVAVSLATPARSSLPRLDGTGVPKGRNAVEVMSSHRQTDFSPALGTTGRDSGEDRGNREDQVASLRIEDMDGDRALHVESGHEKPGALEASNVTVQDDEAATRGVQDRGLVTGSPQSTMGFAVSPVSPPDPALPALSTRPIEPDTIICPSTTGPTEPEPASPPSDTLIRVVPALAQHSSAMNVEHPPAKEDRVNDDQTNPTSKAGKHRAPASVHLRSSKEGSVGDAGLKENLPNCPSNPVKRKPKLKLEPKLDPLGNNSGPRMTDLPAQNRRPTRSLPRPTIIHPRAPLRGFEAYERVSDRPLTIEDARDGHFYVTVHQDSPAEPSSPDELGRWDETTFLDMCRGEAIDMERREEYVGTWKLRKTGTDVLESTSRS